MMYNQGTIGSAAVSLIREFINFDGPINGYSALLIAGSEYYGGTLIPANAAIAQTSLVPVSAQSLRFKAHDIFESVAPWGVSLGGQSLSLVGLGTNATYTLYGADVSWAAGQTQELRFTSYTPNGGLNYLVLDDILFSPIPIPEPGAVALLILGAGLMFGGGRRTCG